MWGMKAYRKAAVASTFSPTHLAVLFEAWDLAQRAGATLDVLHAEAETEEKRRCFENSFRKVGCAATVRWLEGVSPGDAILDAARHFEYDLLIAGALERETQTDGRAFTGSVARRLLVESPCDVLLLPRPAESRPQMEKVFFAVEPGRPVADFVIEVSGQLGLSSVMLAFSKSPFEAALAASRGESLEDIEVWVEETVAVLEGAGIAADVFPVTSNTGFGLCDTIQGNGADLLIVQAGRQDGCLHLPSRLDWLRQIIPTRLLIRSED